MYSPDHVTVLTVTGFPIQKSPDQSLFSNSPKLIAAYHVFHRLLAPRHPPFALYSLATIKPQISLNALMQIYRYNFIKNLLPGTSPNSTALNKLFVFSFTFNRFSKNKKGSNILILQNRLVTDETISFVLYFFP